MRLLRSEASLTGDIFDIGRHRERVQQAANAAMEALETIDREMFGLLATQAPR